MAGSVVVVHPVERSLHRLLPFAIALVARIRVHLRKPLAGLVPVGAEALHVRPETDRESGGVGGAERYRLGDDRPHHGHTEDVGEELHQEVVGSHAAVGFECGQLDARVGVHGIDDLAGLPGSRLEHGAGEVTLGGVAGETGDDTAGVAPPVRRKETGERGHEVNATVEDNGGIYFVPAFSGLFAPHWRGDARGVIAGLTGYATKGHLARAVLEATAWQTREVVDAMNADSGIELTTLKADGGMTANNLLMP